MRCWKCFTSIMPLKVIVQSVAITLAQLCLATSVIANSVEGTADEDIPAGIFDLSIEELLNISIVTVSKRPERILDAPGIVNIVTAADIKRYGANTLFEVLGRLPSVYAYSYPSLRENVISFRGQSEGADNHMLLLINGRPLREGYTGGINGHVYRSFPLEVIDQIEVVRGPGSVLYGTNALSGVVNIITRKPESDLTGEASVSGGSFGTWQANVTTGFEKKDLQILGGLKLLKTDGWKSRGIDASGMYGADRHEDDSYGAMLHLGYKNFTFDASISDSDSEEFDVALTWPLQRYTKRSRFADAGYIHEINQDWKLSLNATYNGYDQNYVNRLITANEDDLLYEATIDGRIADSMNVLAGFSYKSVDGTFTSFGSESDYRQSQVDYYINLDFKPTDSLKLIAGLQMNDAEGVDINYSPRFGAIYRLNQHWAAKFLYGRAFRQATPLEQFLFLPPVAIGDPGLGPERIETYDAHLSYESEKYRAAITLFVSDIMDIITINPGTGIYSNANSISSKGFTLEGSMNLPNNLKLTGSYSYQEHHRDQVNDFYATPNLMVKIGISYDFGNGMYLGIFDSFIGDRSFASPSLEFNPDPDKYHLLTANLRIDPGKYFNSSSLSNTELTIYGDNLLDEDIYAGTVRVNTPNTLLMSSGRAFYMKFTIRY